MVELVFNPPELCISRYNPFQAFCDYDEIKQTDTLIGKDSAQLQ